MIMLSKFIESFEKYLRKAKNKLNLPQIQDRTQWEALPKQEKEHFIKKGEAFLDYQWPFLPAVSYMEYKINGNRSNFENLYFKRRHALGYLAIAECIENKGRFINDLVNGIWVLCEESTWVIPAHLSSIEYVKLPVSEIEVIDLFSADTGALLSLIYYLFSEPFDDVFPEIMERLELEIKTRIIDIYLKRNDFGWLGFHGRPVNNWNPWINSNVLTAFLLVEDDKDRQLTGLKKIIRSLDNFINHYPEDGGCDEGPGYWFVAGGALLDALDQLNKVTDGYINVFDEPLIKNMGKYIQNLHINENYFVNFADAAPKFIPEASVIYRFGLNIKDPSLVSFAAKFLDVFQENANGAWYRMYRSLAFLFRDKTIENTILTIIKTENNQTNFLPLKHKWFENLQVLIARSQPITNKGLFLAVKGGHNSESHNHNDVGNFIVYLNGEPCLIDVGVGEYTKKTFSADRYKIWTMNSANHNLPTINNCMQLPGKDYCAKDVVYKHESEIIDVSMDIAKAYPKESRINSWIRHIRFLKSETPAITITDSYNFEQSAIQTNEISLSLMVFPKPKIVSETNKDAAHIELETLNGSILEIQFNAALLDCTVESIEIKDSRLIAVWGNRLYRVILSSKNLNQQGELKLVITELNPK
jgi:heparinase II/III-like protein